MLANYADPLPGVPKVESPFFAEFFDAADPHYETAKALHEKGYAVIDFPDPDFNRISERIKHDLVGRFDWEAWRRNGGGLRIQDAWRFNEDIRAIAANQHILDLLSHLYGRRAFPFQTLNFPVGTEQHYHTDSIHFSAMPERFMCGVWTAFEDIGNDQGPLLYYPGTHNWPIYRNEHIRHTYLRDAKLDQVTYEPLWERLVDLHGLTAERFHPRKGQALIWAANLLHGGDRHVDRSRTRWSQVTHYLFEDCIYYTPMGSNEPAGDFMTRDPINIATGEVIGGSYHGLPMSAFTGGRALRPGDPGAPRFDPSLYLQINTDVADAGGDAWQHYLLHGMAERRRWY